MLTFESPYYEIKGVLVFRDHASPTMFHYLAGPPQLTRSDDGKPHLMLLKYRNALDAMSASPRVREQLGGAFLMFGVDCRVPESVKDDIKRELESKLPPGSGPVALAPVLYTKGTVSVIALDEQRTAAPPPEGGSAESQSKFVRGIKGSSVPSLLQDQRAIFSISLTPDAATLIEKAYEAELSPIGVMYELEFSGLRPALAVRATVDKKKVYEHFKIGAHFGLRAGPGGGQATEQPTADHSEEEGTGEPTRQPTADGDTAKKSGTQVAIDADISYGIEKLKESGAISIEIIRQQEGQSVAEMERNAMTLLKDSILNEFFKPAMTAQPSPTAQAAGALAAAQALMATQGDTSRGQAGQAAGGTRVELGFQLQFKKEEELKTVTFDYNVVAPVTQTHAPNGFFSTLLTETERQAHIKEIDLNSPFFQIIDVDISTTADFAALDIKSIVVELQYGGTIEDPNVTGSAEFTPASNAPKHFQAFRTLDDFSYRYRVSYKFGQSEKIAAQRSDYQTAWLTSTSRSLVVHPPEDVTMLRVFAEGGVVDWDVVDKIQTRLIYDDLPNQFHAERDLIIEAASQRQEWLVRLTNPALMKYKAQHVWHLKNHTELTRPADTFDNKAQLFVGDPFTERIEVVVQPLVDPQTVKKVNIQFDYVDEENDYDVHKLVEFVGPDFRPTTVSIPIVNPEAREYTYTVTLIKPTGPPETQQPIKTDQLALALTEGGVYFDVNIVTLGDLAQLGILGLQIDLRAEPLPGQQPRVESFLFEPGGEKRVTRRLLLRADRPLAFEYRLQLFTATRAPIETDWMPHDNKILPLQLQHLLNG